MNILDEYEKVFKEWEALGIIEQVKDKRDEMTGKNEMIGHYLPHHAVIKSTSITTKIRPVFNASARDRNSNSLNNCLEKGDNLIKLIPNLILQFRLHEIGVTGDIEKAFLQIKIQERDRDNLRFLWWENVKDQSLKIYRHCRVVFGISPGPFLLGAVIFYHLDHAPDSLKDTAEKLKNSFYLDNCDKCQKYDRIR